MSWFGRVFADNVSFRAQLRQDVLAAVITGAAVAALLTFALASQLLLVAANFGREANFWRALWMAARESHAWIYLAIPVFLVCRAFPLRGRRWGLSLLAHLLAAAVIVLLYTLISAKSSDRLTAVFVTAPLPPPTADHFQLEITFWRRLLAELTTRGIFHLLTYGIFAAVWHGLEYQRESRAQELRNRELGKLLSEARLASLRAQLQPHFLFNSLNGIASTLHHDPQAADEMIASLSELLRASLADTGQFVPLNEELRVLGHYIDLQKARFADRLSVEVNIPPECLPILVPPLILQPIIENAVRYGFEPQRKAGRVSVSAALADDYVTLSIADDGAGFPPHFTEHIGLGNTRRRLAELYGSSAQLMLGRSASGGALVELRLPVKR